MKKAVGLGILVLLGVVGAVVLLWTPARETAFAWLEGRDKADEPLLLYGNVDIREVELAFRQSGRLVSMAFNEGDRVQSGQLMAELDATPFKQAKSVVEAEVRRAKAELAKLYTGSRPQEIAQSEALVQQAEATLDNAQRDYQRKVALLRSRSVSESAVDNALAARDEAVANLASKRQALALLKAGTRSEDIAAGEASVAVAEAKLAQLQTALEDTRLVAPIDAVVLSRVREPGSMVGTSSPVYTLSLRDPLYIRAYVSEANLGRVVPGTRVRVRTDSSDKEYEGQIGFVSPRAEFTPKSVETTDLRTDLVYRLRIVVANADDGLRQGMPVTILMDTPPHEG